jgi:hypothetical protein
VEHKRVVIVGNGSLLTSGVESLLRENPAVDLQPIREEGERLFARIRETDPAVIVLAANDASAGHPVSVDRLLRENPSARIVAVGFGQAAIEVYSSERVEYATVADFMAAIDAAGTTTAEEPADPSVPGDGDRQATRRRGDARGNDAFGVKQATQERQEED